jgi:spore coat protein U-like protein
MIIRNALIAAGSALALSTLATAALAAGSVASTAPASVTVLAPINLTKTQNLVFGSVMRPSNASPNTVTLDTSDTVTLTGGGNGSIVASTPTSAKFNLTAPAGTTYTTTQALSFTLPGLTNIIAGAPVATTGTLGTVPVGGTQELRYGANFDITSSTPAQTYTGTLSVTVNYP